MTDNEQLIDYVENQLSDGSIEEDMSNKGRINSIAKALASTDASKIDRIEALLKEKELRARVDKLWEARGLNSNRMSRYKEAFFSTILTHNSSLKSKIQFLYMITKNTVGIDGDVFKKRICRKH